MTAAAPAIDWDAFRAAYPAMGWAEAAAFYSQVVWPAYPDQSDYSPGHLARFFRLRPGARRVIEVGGWTGQAAAQVLAATPALIDWCNLEICEPAVAAPATADPRYHPSQPWCWPWEAPVGQHDTAVLAHVVEHLTGAQLRRLAAWLARAGVRAVYLEAPLWDRGRDWAGTATTHVLELGWPAVLQVFADQGLPEQRQAAYTVPGHTRRRVAYLARPWWLP